MLSLSVKLKIDKQMLFRASMDMFTKISTAFVFLIFGAVLVFPYFFVKAFSMQLTSVLSFVFLIITIICYVYKPLSYEISSSRIIIKRLVGSINIELSHVKEVKSIGKLAVFSTVRLFGVGGLFGYFGTFWNNKYGRMTYYATKRKGAVMIVTHKNALIVITPDDVDLFLEQFLKAKN